MKRYDTIKGTPLGFHRVYTSLIIPLEAFLNLVVFFVVLQDAKEGFALSDAFDLVMSFVYIVLCFAAGRNLKHYRRSGLLALGALLVLKTLNNLFNAWRYLRNGSLEFFAAEIISVLVFALVAVYYYKRERLFTKDGDLAFIPMPSQKEDEDITVIHEEPVEEEEEEVGEYDCPNCGRHITDGAVFCPKCGAQTRAVRR